MLGLTSVTFRNLRAEDIIALTAEAGLDGIEWGADVHVKPGDEERARQVGRMTREAGLRVLSYGSYLNTGRTKEPEKEFEAILNAALCLEAPMIRVWAGTIPPREAGPEDYAAASSLLRRLAERAGQCGIQVSTEYHRRTLTETADSALRLLEAAGACRTYWQPNPDISEEANLGELTRIQPYLTNVHVFCWEGSPETRFPLSHGEEIWRRYLRQIRSDRKERSYLLEFVKDDSTKQFLEDAATLKRWFSGNYEEDAG